LKIFKSISEIHGSLLLQGSNTPGSENWPRNGPGTDGGCKISCNISDLEVPTAGLGPAGGNKKLIEILRDGIRKPPEKTLLSSISEKEKDVPVV
jgi:hypothetical protein